ncbi:MAG: DUF1800 domain-containing protein [Saprospiraceae bacterium]|nr:DUF1800 domain-containing protein [Saprospiraceae bacterium]
MANLQPYVPNSEKPWDKQRVIHFYRRLGFGPRPEEITAALATDPLTFIEGKLDGIKNKPLPTPPIWANYTAANYEADPDLIGEHRTELFNAIYDEMLADGLRSKLFMFWHNHFVTELNVYNCNKYLWNYYYLLLKHCVGNFKIFVEEMGKCPAMLDYLNGNDNEVGKPNENYARELMELFTMGENNGYTQNYVVEVARALTGWKCNPYTCDNVTFKDTKFDKTNKVIFGKTGNWGYNEVHNLIFTERKAQVAEYICGKLYRHFVQKNIDAEFVEQLATLFIQSNWELLPVLKALFKSEHFYSKEFIGAIIKSPLDCFIDLSRLSGVDPAGLGERYGNYRYGANNLGMEVFNPINVAGWPGHQEWINENTLTRRWSYCRDIVNTLVNATNREQLRTLAINLAAPVQNDPDAITRALCLHFLGAELEDDLHQKAVLYFKGDIPQNYFEDGSWNLSWNEAPFQVGNLLQFLVKLPEFQLS